MNRTVGNANWTEITETSTLYDAININLNGLQNKTHNFLQNGTDSKTATGDFIGRNVLQNVTGNFTTFAWNVTKDYTTTLEYNKSTMHWIESTSDEVAEPLTTVDYQTQTSVHVKKICLASPGLKGLPTHPIE